MGHGRPKARDRKETKDTWGVTRRRISSDLSKPRRDRARDRLELLRLLQTGNEWLSRGGIITQPEIRATARHAAAIIQRREQGDQERPRRKRSTLFRVTWEVNTQHYRDSAILYYPDVDPVITIEWTGRLRGYSTHIVVRVKPESFEEIERST